MEKLEDIARGGVVDRATAGLKTIVPTKSSREVEFCDLWKVMKDAVRIKLAMLHPFPGKYERAASISHCQIEADDPLRFFVIDKDFGWFFGWGKILPARVIINPKIISHGTQHQHIREGCMSYPFRNTIKMKRWEIVEAEYWTFFGKRRKKLYLFRAAMIQHELDHMNMLDIYHDRWKKRK